MTNLEDVKKKILEVLASEGRALSSAEIMQKTGFPSYILSSALFELLKENAVRKVYDSDYDPTRAFDTAKWMLLLKAGEPSSDEEPAEHQKDSDNMKLVLSVPLSLLSIKNNLLNSSNALDFSDAYIHVVEAAEEEIRIMCPVIDSYGMFPIMTKIANSSRIKVKVITELEKSRELSYFMDVADRSRLLVADALRKKGDGHERSRKIGGVHSKMIIADRKIALIGSFNFSKYHYLTNFDIGFLIYNRNLVEKLLRIFEEIWSYVADRPHNV